MSEGEAPASGERPPTVSTRHLYRRAHTGDRVALEQLLERVRPRLEAWVAARLGPALRSRLQVDDLVQEILIKSYTAIPSFEPREKRAFYAWLFTVGRNTMRDWHKRLHAAKRQATREEALHSSVAGGGATPSEVAVGHEEQERFLTALASLPPRYREIVCLRRLENVENRQAAERLGISPKNASVLLVRAMRALRKSMA